MTANHTEIEKLDQAISDSWNSIFISEISSQFTGTGMSKDPRIYALYLTQVYHYAYHTPRILALAGANAFNTDTHFMQHLFEHAMEETGHELMALHDLKMLGIEYGAQTMHGLPRMLPATETMIGYVKYLATSETPYRVMGYSYWIERPYRHILSFMEQLEKDMALNKNQLTFYYNHLHIDQKHGQDIEHILIRVCQTPEQWAAVREAALKSMQLMLNMLLEIIAAYKQLGTDNSSFKAIQSIS